MADKKPKKMTGSDRSEIRWALEKMAKADELIKYGQLASAAGELDIARLHLETAAVAAGQQLVPRLEAAQALEERHAVLKGKPL